jgi:spoIIIJ-associated protein
MKAFLGKLFGGKKNENEAQTLPDLVADVLDQVIALSGLAVAFDLSENPDTNEINVELHGEDEALLVEKEGQLLDAIQLYLKRVGQHQMPDERVNIMVDCNNYRDSANQSLIELAEKLKGIAVNKGKPVYFRALPPRDRKVVHQYLAEDGVVKSRSVGDGLYKKIKIYPAKNVGDFKAEEQQPAG